MGRTKGKKRERERNQDGTSTPERELSKRKGPQNEMKKHDSNIRDLWNSINWARLQINGFQKEKTKKWGLKIFLKKL